VKFALVSHVLPPSPSGQAMALYRLLRGLDPDDYCLISRQSYDAGSQQNNYSDRLPGRYYYLPDLQITPSSSSGFIKRLKIITRIILRILLIPGVVWHGRQIAGIVRRENCGAVLACTGDLRDLPAGYLASRLAGVPFYPYLFDYYSYQWVEPISRWLAQLLEPVMLKGAAGVIAPNEFLRDALRHRYGVEATVIHNPCDLSEYETIPNDAPSGNGGEFGIVYTGAVYGAQFDAFRNLLAAIELLGRPNVKLHLYTAQSPRDLAERGISGPVVCHGHQPPSAIPGIQRRADLLFLPLAFNSPYPAELIKTSAPGKIGEYLAAGRPILVHAPPDSFVVWYFRRHECGLVVDQNDPAKLAQAIEQLLADAGLRQRLGERAWEQARTDFSVLTARSTLAGLMKLGVASNSL
jgi:glycosyltransferase involved in cell wall biosynthesis